MPATVPDHGCLAIADRRRDATLPLVLVASAALIDADGRVMLQQRPADKSWPGWWEFPGGKIHQGETPEATVVRELREELGIDISESCLAPFTFTSYAYEDFHLLMMLYLCRVWRGTPRPAEGQSLKWLRPLDLARQDKLLPADTPLVAMLRDFL
jgi:8-oxo-dGTP diphosphatase